MEICVVPINVDVARVVLPPFPRSSLCQKKRKKTQVVEKKCMRVNVSLKIDCVFSLFLVYAMKQNRTSLKGKKNCENITVEQQNCDKGGYSSHFFLCGTISQLSLARREKKKPAEKLLLCFEFCFTTPLALRLYQSSQSASNISKYFFFLVWFVLLVVGFICYCC